MNDNGSFHVMTIWPQTHPMKNTQHNVLIQACMFVVRESFFDFFFGEKRFSFQSKIKQSIPQKKVTLFVLLSILSKDIKRRKFMFNKNYIDSTIHYFLLKLHYVRYHLSSSKFLCLLFLFACNYLKVLQSWFYYFALFAQLFKQCQSIKPYVMQVIKMSKRARMNCQGSKEKERVRRWRYAI